MKTLIIYGSRRGTTTHCAGLIQNALGNNALLVEANHRKLASLIQEHQRVIIGANAFNFKLNKKVSSMIKKNLSQLLSKELHLFICSGAKTEKDVQTLYEKSYPSILLDQAKSKENFGGRLDTSRESWLIRRILKKMGIEDYDRFQEERVRQWSSELAKVS